MRFRWSCLNRKLSWFEPDQDVLMYRFHLLSRFLEELFFVAVDNPDVLLRFATNNEAARMCRCGCARR